MSGDYEAHNRLGCQVMAVTVLVIVAGICACVAGVLA